MFIDMNEIVTAINTLIERIQNLERRLVEDEKAISNNFKILDDVTASNVKEIGKAFKHVGERLTQLEIITSKKWRKEIERPTKNGSKRLDN